MNRDVALGVSPATAYSAAVAVLTQLLGPFGDTEWQQFLDYVGPTASSLRNIISSGASGVQLNDTIVSLESNLTARIVLIDASVPPKVEESIVASLQAVVSDMTNGDGEHGLEDALTLLGALSSADRV